MNPLLETLVTVFWTLRASGLGIGIGELLEGLNIAEEVKTEAQFKNLKNNLRLLWSVNTNLHAEEEFENAWVAQVDTRIDELLAMLRDSPLSPSATLTSQPMASSLIVTPVAVAESLLPAPAPILLPEDPGEIKPPVNVIAPVDQTETDNESRNGDEENGRDTRSDIHRSSPGGKRDRYTPRRFPGRRFKFKVVTDTPELLRPVGAAPATIPPNLRGGQPEAIFAYAPVSRLAMTYGWQYLRRPVPDGPANVLDIDATIAQVTQQGFFLSPIYRRWQSNHAHLIFLIDQDGSMRPFHEIARDLVDTARDESSIKQVEAFYFHDVFDVSIYEDEHFRRWKSVDEAMQNCTPNTSIMIVSDAGAARGSKNEVRSAAALQMVRRLQQNTNLVAWLNPVPRDRWTGSSAEIIANETNMFQLDTDGFSNAVDVLQGRGVSS